MLYILYIIIILLINYYFEFLNLKIEKYFYITNKNNWVKIAYIKICLLNCILRFKFYY